MKIPELREGQQWARGALLNPDNLDRQVIAVWNGNTHRAEVGTIVKQTRRGWVHVRVAGSATLWRMEVSQRDHGFAHGYHNHYSVSVETPEHVEHVRVRRDLVARVKQIRWDQQSSEMIQQVLDLVDRAVADG